VVDGSELTVGLRREDGQKEGGKNLGGKWFGEEMGIE
jgi:hypothetical protein